MAHKSYCKRAAALGYFRTNPLTGLTFPLADPFGHAGDMAALYWSGAALIPHYNCTYIFWTRHAYQDEAYYSNMFWCSNFGGAFHDPAPNWDLGYYGCQPFPYPSDHSIHKYEISTGFDDWYSSESVVYDTWRANVVIVTGTFSKPIINYYYKANIDSSVVTKDWNEIAANFTINLGLANALIIGNNPWPGEKDESLSGSIRGIQHYSTAMTFANAQIALAQNYDADVLALGFPSLHYLNMNPTPSDISDKSGAGHHPAWVNSVRPTLYTA